MNPSKAWNAKLEAGIFLAIYKPVQAVCIDNNGSSVIMILLLKNLEHYITSLPLLKNLQ